MLKASTYRQTGRIQARKPDGSVLGFVRNTNSSQPMLVDMYPLLDSVFTFVLHSSGFNFWGPDQDLFVSFTASASGQGPFDIVAIVSFYITFEDLPGHVSIIPQNAIFSAPFYVGASAALNSSSIGLKNSK